MQSGVAAGIQAPSGDGVKAARNGMEVAVSGLQPEWMWRDRKRERWGDMGDS